MSVVFDEVSAEMAAPPEEAVEEAAEESGPGTPQVMQIQQYLALSEDIKRRMLRVYAD